MDAPKNQNGRKRTPPKVKIDTNGQVPTSKWTLMLCMKWMRHGMGRNARRLGMLLPSTALVVRAKVLVSALVLGLRSIATPRKQHEM